jgi:hypothetical protein
MSGFNKPSQTHITKGVQGIYIDQYLSFTPKTHKGRGEIINERRKYSG